jgi:radical SAM superfamily enzyme YgiQ (UPF0313 family)
MEEAKFEVEFLDGCAMNLGQGQVVSILKKSRPGLLVLHTTTPSIDSDLSYASLAKECLSDCRTVMVGPHVTAEPEDTLMRADGSLDVVVRGEYDYTLRELAGLSASRWNDQRLAKVSGISYLDSEGQMVHTSSRPYVDVNELPFPAWRHIDPKWYRDAGKRFPFITLISGRGCFGNCTFCRDVPLMEGRKLRMRDPQLVVDEIEYVFSLFPYLREIMFETDTLTAAPKHVQGICDCRMLMVGFEFGTQESLDAVKKGTTLEQSMRLAEEAQRLGFTVHGCFMFGAPGETKESALKTIEFAKSLPMDTVQFSGICAYPGSEIYRWADERGFLLPKAWRKWVDENWEQVTVLSYPELSKDEIDRLIDKGLKEFYLRPKQILRMARGICTWDDLRRKLYGLQKFMKVQLPVHGANSDSNC